MGTILGLGLGGLAALVVAAAGVAQFNRLIRARNALRKAWGNIDVLLRQRRDEIPALAEVVKAAASHERGALEELSRLRESRERASESEAQALAENALLLGLWELMGRAEAYPELRTSENFLAFQARLAGLETRIAERRTYFNDCVAVYNTRIQRFPERVVARALGWGPHPFLDARP